MGSKKYKFELPSGTWTIADRFRYSYYGATAKGYTLLKIKGNKAIEGFSIAELDIGARFQGAFNDAMHLIMFKNEYDGCYERPEYYIMKYNLGIAETIKKFMPSDKEILNY